MRSVIGQVMVQPGGVCAMYRLRGRDPGFARQNRRGHGAKRAIAAGVAGRMFIALGIHPDRDDLLFMADFNRHQRSVEQHPGPQLTGHQQADRRKQRQGHAKPEGKCVSGHHASWDRTGAGGLLCASTKKARISAQRVRWMWKSRDRAAEGREGPVSGRARQGFAAPATGRPSGPHPSGRNGAGGVSWPHPADDAPICPQPMPRGCPARRMPSAHGRARSR